MNRLKFADIDCSAFKPVYDIGSMLKTEPTEGVKHVLEFRSGDIHYEGASPAMLQHNVLGFLQRENGIADAKRRGWRPR